MSGGEPVGRHEFEAVLQAQRQISDTKFEALIGQLKDMNKNMARSIEDNEKLVGQYSVQANNLDIKLDDLRAEMREGRVDDDKLDTRLEILEKKNRPTRTIYARSSVASSVGLFS